MDGVYYKEFPEKPGHFRYNDVANTEIILPKPKDNESTLQIRFKDARWVRLIGYSLYKSGCWTVCARSRRDTPTKMMARMSEQRHCTILWKLPYIPRYSSV